MNSRPLLIGTEKLGIFIESKSIERLLHQSDPRALRLLPYREVVKLFDFRRSLQATTNASLSKVAECALKKGDKGSVPSIELGKRQVGFFYRMSDIEAVALEVFKKKTVTPEELRTVLNVFVHATLDQSGRSLFVTNDKVLLKRRLWFEAHFPGVQLNICSVRESLEVMDLFAKNRGEYRVSSGLTYNKGLWYLMDFKSKVPHHNFVTPSMESLGSRFQFALMSVDEVGTQYYSEANNDTMDTAMYHFNYFISLVSGIFDSLAIEAKTKLNLHFDHDDIPSRTSLSRDTGRDFLRALRQENERLRKHIGHNVAFIKLIYKLRELVLHREGLKVVKFVFKGSDERWEANFIKPSPAVLQLIKQCGDKKSASEVVSDWGVFNSFLSPYRFSQSAASVLAKFCDSYLRLLGYNDFTRARGNEKLLKDLEFFEGHRLAN